MSQLTFVIIPTPEEEAEGRRQWEEALAECQAGPYNTAPRQPLTKEERLFLVDLMRSGVTVLVDPLANRRHDPHPGPGYYDAWKAIAWALRSTRDYGWIIERMPEIALARMLEGTEE